MRFEQDGGPTLYEVLGVGPQASAAEIRVEYRRLVRQSHPDLNPTDTLAGERMAKLNHAARVLLDPCLRQAYDRVRAKCARSGHCKAQATVEWYERDAVDEGAEWSASDPEVVRENRRQFAGFLREIRGYVARASHDVLEFGRRAPAAAKVPVIGLCLIAGLILMGVARPGFWSSRTDIEQPTSVSPSALFP